MKLTIKNYKFIHESKTCIGKATGEPVKEYRTEQDAWAAVNLIKDKKMYPYKCNKCGFYHLAPVETKLNVVKKGCSCCGYDGRSKNLYLTESDAEKQRKRCESERHVVLRIYRCEEGKGWHLTHFF